MVVIVVMMVVVVIMCAHGIILAGVSWPLNGQSGAPRGGKVEIHSLDSRNWRRACNIEMPGIMDSGLRVRRAGE